MRRIESVAPGVVYTHDGAPPDDGPWVRQPGGTPGVGFTVWHRAGGGGLTAGDVQQSQFLGAIPGIIGGIGTVAGAIGGAVGIIKGAFGGGPKTLPPAGGYGSPPAIPPLPNETTPRGIVRRMVERVLPGGRTGKELMPYEGTEVDRAGRPIAVHPTTIERRYAPPGYVIVRGPNGEAIAMLKGVARSMGLWKGRPKPPISGYDARAIKRAARAQDRVKRLAGDVGLAYCKRPKGSGLFKKKGRRK